MLSTVLSCAILGIDGYIMNVEVDITSGMPYFEIVGMPDLPVREAKERVRTAIRNAGFSFPFHRIVINLAPADVKKEGSAFDLPIALGILAASEQLGDPSLLDESVICGELSLDGSIRQVNGVLPMAITALNHGKTKIILPTANANEAAFIEGLDVLPVASLAEAVALFEPDAARQPYRTEINLNDLPAIGLNEDFADVKGQDNVKRALMVAAAGAHNLLMIGPPGSGKTMLARRLPSILPPLTFAESLEVSKIYSIAGLLPPKTGLLQNRPFRTPHHTISNAGLIGGGRIPRPGEISLAHLGVLFLDELPEFKHDIIELMRQPLEDRQVSIARAAAAITYPAGFMLVAAMNPCPCGHYGDQSASCTCTPPQVQRYIGKLSGPLLDRVDIHITVPRLHYKDVADGRRSEGSAQIRDRVIAARQKQTERFKGTKIFTNAQMSVRQVKEYCHLDADGVALMKEVFNRMGLSMRAHDRILKVARTIADLAGAEAISLAHLAEAVQYRELDRQYFR